MRVTKKSIITGNINSMELDITEAQIDRWNAGEYAQDVFTNLSVDEREFILSGITPEEWQAHILLDVDCDD